MTGQLSGCAEEIGGLKARLSILNETKTEMDIKLEEEMEDKTLKIAEMESLSRQLTDANIEISNMQTELEALHETKVHLEESLAREIGEKTDCVKKISALEELVECEGKELKVVQAERTVLNEMLESTRQELEEKSEENVLSFLTFANRLCLRENYRKPYRYCGKILIR